jgi:hypothetical protein
VPGEVCELSVLVESEQDAVQPPATAQQILPDIAAREENSRPIPKDSATNRQKLAPVSTAASITTLSCPILNETGKKIPSFAEGY